MVFRKKNQTDLPDENPDLNDEDDMATDVGAFSRKQNYWDSEAKTDLGASRRSRNASDEDVDPTELGKLHKGGGDMTEIDFVDTGTMGLLWVKEGERRGQVYKVKDGATVGRTTGDLVLDDPKVSNPHAKFTLEDDKFVIWDFGSRNGTLVNGTRIRAATPLNENDTIQIGSNTFVFKILA